MEWVNVSDGIVPSYVITILADLGIYGFSVFFYNEKFVAFIYC